MIPITRILLAAALVASAAPLAAQHDHEHPASSTPSDVSRLGRVEFANSGSAAAQPAFQRGVALLHSFLYDEAAEAFRQAQAADPRFAMAYWGEVMAIYGDSASTASVFQRLGRTPAERQAKAPTQRERDYLALVERFAFAPDNDTTSYHFAEAWRTLHEAYPTDDDATLFYALSLASLRYVERNDAAKSLRLGVEAGALAEEVFARRPDHPGAAHYLIHIYDDARLAPLGLRAARVYSRIAPAAFHAVHMPSHIFFQFGMWDDVVAANARGWALSKARTAGGDVPPGEWDYHALDWLHFAWLQQGRVRQARVAADSVRAIWTAERVAAAPAWRQPFLSRLAQGFDARDALETGRYPATIDHRTLVSGTDFLVAALAAGERRDAAAMDSVMARFAVYQDSVVKDDPTAFGPAQRATLLRLRALHARAAGHADSAIALLRLAADSVEADPSLYLAEGPQRANVGTTHLLLGQVQLQAGKAADALASFDRALELSPGRAAAVLGRARALSALGRRDEARRTYARLAETWRNADPDLPALAEVRAGSR